MAKCLACEERKGNRFCPVVGGNICSLCCGSKREKEIRCVPSCDYLKKGREYQLNRDIVRTVDSGLHAESEDMFQMDEVIPFVASMEEFFIDFFYHDRNVNDDHIHEALKKIYAFQSGKIPALKGDSRTEELIFLKFREIDKREKDLAEGLKARAILRIIRSIRSSSGGILGNRNYLETIYSQFTGKGKWTTLFKVKPKE